MRAAVIGVGRMGRRHVRIARDLGLQIAGVVDQSEESLATTRAELLLSEAQCFRDVPAMLATVKPEVVIVATTAPTHADYTCLAAESGAKFVLCEKPMATSLDACDRMAAVCATHGTRLAVNHPMRFMPQYSEARRIVTSDAFGPLATMVAISGNMGLAMNGTHYFEAFRYLTGEPAKTVTAWFSPDKVSNPRGAQFEDRAGEVRLETATGKRFALFAGADQGHGLFVTYAGRNGRLENDQLEGTLRLTLRDAEHRDAVTTRYDMPWTVSSPPVSPTDAFAPSRSVLQALLDGGAAPGAAEGRLACATLVAAYVSHERGHARIDLQTTDLPGDRIFPWA